MKKHIYKLMDFAEWLDQARQMPEKTGIEDYDTLASRLPRGQGFNSCPSFEDAERLALAGWHAGALASVELSRRYGQIAGDKMIIRRRKYAVAGHRPHIARYLAGRPDCMVKTSRHYADGENTGRQVVRILISGTFAAQVSADVIQRRGAAIMAAIEALETAGRSVELMLNFAVMKETPKTETALEYDIMAKNSDRPIEHDRLAFLLCHADTLRRLHFSVMEQQPQGVRRSIGIKIPGNYGKFAQASQRHNADIYLPALGHDPVEFQSDAAAVGWILKILKEQGVELAE